MADREHVKVQRHPASRITLDEPRSTPVTSVFFFILFSHFKFFLFLGNNSILILNHCDATCIEFKRLFSEQTVIYKDSFSVSSTT